MYYLYDIYYIILYMYIRMAYRQVIVLISLCIAYLNALRKDSRIIIVTSAAVYYIVCVVK